MSHTHTHRESTENCAGLFARFVKQFVCSVTRTLCRRREREQLIALVDCLITGCPHPSPSLFYPLVCLVLRLSLHKWQCIRQTFVQNTRHLVSLWAWQPRNQLGVHLPQTMAHMFDFDYRVHRRVTSLQLSQSCNNYSSNNSFYLCCNYNCAPSATATVKENKLK